MERMSVILSIHRISPLMEMRHDRIPRDLRMEISLNMTGMLGEFVKKHVTVDDELRKQAEYGVMEMAMIEDCVGNEMGGVPNIIQLEDRFIQMTLTSDEDEIMSESVDDEKQIEEV